ncbi:MAG: CocE/NonD family hydrolase [Planctomycetota bacterium]|jgi:predicted acyl esterase
MRKRAAITKISIAVVLITAALCCAKPAQTLMVPMREGVKLATDVYLPDGKGPWPAILFRTPYGKSTAQGQAMMANQRGYAFVSQDIRGRFGSEGLDYPVFGHDGWGKNQDGYDTVEWVAAQKWSDGKVGTVGASANGITQNMMAPSRPPHLVCQYVAVAFSSMYNQAAYQGGAFRKSLVEGWMNGNKFSPENLKEMRAHPDYDDFCKQFDPELVAHRINVPILFLGGWYDIFNAGSINSFLTIQKKGDKGARGKCRLVMGPYGHGRSEDLIFPNTEYPKPVSMLNWFDIWMKKNGKGIDDIPVVQYFVMGDPADSKNNANVWKTAEDWPVPAKIKPFYFNANGKLRPRPPKKVDTSLSYKYDPKDPVPTIGGANLIIKKGPRDQRPVEERPDVLLFTSGELKKPVEITGPVKVRLWASSTATDTDFTAKLCDVYPDGRSMIVLDGIIRARHRNSMEKSELIEPGKIYEYEIDLWSTSLVFTPGHRIRVAISSSNSPRFEPNPNTGKHSGMDDQTKVATNTIYLEAKHPSHILLPVVAR